MPAHATAVSLLEAPPTDPVLLLVKRVQQGDVRAYERLYRQFVGRVYAVCLRMLAETTWAERITQDVFVQAWERLHTFRGDGPFGAWLHRLTVNTVLLELRTRKRRLKRIQPTSDLVAYDRPASQAPEGSRMDLEAAIAQLPEKARLVFVLYAVEGYKHHEIADLLNVTVGTTKAQLHRARGLLRTMLTR